MQKLVRVDEALLAKAAKLTGINDEAMLMREALRALVERETNCGSLCWAE